MISRFLQNVGITDNGRAGKLRNFWRFTIRAFFTVLLLLRMCTVNQVDWNRANNIDQECGCDEFKIIHIDDQMKKTVRIFGVILITM
jgi:hypothetical protein